MCRTVPGCKREHTLSRLPGRGHRPKHQRTEVHQHTKPARDPVADRDESRLRQMEADKREENSYKRIGEIEHGTLVQGKSHCDIKSCFLPRLSLTAGASSTPKVLARTPSGMKPLLPACTSQAVGSVKLALALGWCAFVAQATRLASDTREAAIAPRRRRGPDRGSPG